MAQDTMVGLAIHGPKSYIDNGHWNEFKPRKRGKKQ